MVLRAVRLRAGQEAVRAVQRSHETARGRLVTVAMVIDPPWAARGGCRSEGGTPSLLARGS